MKKNLVIAFCALTVFCQAQKFHAQASLPEINNTGFYRINISPELASYLSNDFTNARIFDQDDREVPYVFETAIPGPDTVLFQEYEIIDWIIRKNMYSELVLRNPSRAAINNISLLIKNADITKTATLSGSDDKINWFALKHEFSISNLNNPAETFEVNIVDFPLSNYEYYSIRISDKKSAPLNILKAGYYFRKRGEDQRYTRITKSVLSQTDSIKQTFIRLRFDTLMFVDKLEWAASGMPFYLRNATIWEEKERTTKKGKKEIYREFIESFEVNSAATAHTVQLPAVKVKSLLITIENKDNPALKFDSIATFQLNRNFSAWLEKGKRYIIRIGSEKLSAPQYDLAFFKDSIPSQIPVIEAGKISLFEKEHTVSSTSFFRSNIFIWSAIIVVVVLLGFMSIKLVRETSAVNQN
jgi:hypothetical protein